MQPDCNSKPFYIKMKILQYQNQFDRIIFSLYFSFHDDNLKKII